MHYDKHLFKPIYALKFVLNISLYFCQEYSFTHAGEMLASYAVQGSLQFALHSAQQHDDATARKCWWTPN
jgi:hypothetical protein